MRCRWRTQQIVADLHDHAGNSIKLFRVRHELTRSHKTVVLEVMRFHERRGGQGARRIERIRIEPEMSGRVFGKDPLGVVPGAGGWAVDGWIGIENAAPV